MRRTNRTAETHQYTAPAALASVRITAALAALDRAAAIRAAHTTHGSK